MGRNKAFDEDQALDAVAELFWKQGYEGTSLSDLEAHLGLGRQSLYNAFGDKRSLFLKALERYASWNAESLVAPLLRPEAGLKDLRHYFDSLVDFLTPEGERRGCLVANSLLEIGAEDDAVVERCRGNQAQVLEGFRNALGNGVATGELPKSTEVATTAHLLMAQTYGFTVLSKSGMSRQELRAIVGALLEGLGLVP